MNRPDEHQGAGAPLSPRGGKESLRRAEEQLDKVLSAVRDYAIFLLDPEGYVLTWNAGAAAIKGYQADEIIGEHFSRFYPAEALATNWPEQELAEARRVGRFEDEGWRLRKDGSRFWANVVITTLRDEEGGVRGFLKITRDLTERRTAEETLRASEERLRLILEAVHDYAIFMLDPGGHVVTWNPGAQRIKGWSAAEIVGHHFSRFYPPEDVTRQWPDQELRIARSQGRYEEQGWRLRKDGSRFWANVVITPMYDSSGTLRGYAKVTRDLTERRMAEEALRRAYDDLEVRVRDRTAELQRLDRHKDQFLAMLGHELRNPLAPIRNALEILAHDSDRETQERARAIIGRQTEHLVRLVDDLLDVSRIMYGKIDLRRERADLASAVTRGVEAAQPALDAHGHRLETRLPSEPLHVVGDVVRLAQVVTNLLTNAAKYTPTPGRIELALTREGAEAVLAVRDPGIGIPPDLLPRIFDFFVQGDLPLARSGGGLGIGLTLVRHLVALHGGSVKAESAGEWQGTTFTVRLPLVAGPGERTAAPGGAESEARHRVLVVDDNVDAAESLASLLELWGHEAHALHDGPSVVPAVTRLRPDVVLLDIGLPGLDGYEVARELRALDGHPVRLLAAITGYGQPEDRRRSAAAGFDVHLTKPVDPARLRELIAELDR